MAAVGIGAQTRMVSVPKEHKESQGQDCCCAEGGRGAWEGWISVRTPLCPRGEVRCRGEGSGHLAGLVRPL